MGEWEKLFLLSSKKKKLKSNLKISEDNESLKNKYMY